MLEVRKNDLRNLLTALLSPYRLLWLGLTCYLAWLFFNMSGFFEYFSILLLGLGMGIYATNTWVAFDKKRFKNRRHADLWDGVKDRHRRFRQAIKRAPKHLGGNLTELPKSIDQTSKHLYLSLRKADLVLHEITKSEGDAGVLSLRFQVWSQDPETSELYVLADKNVADYRRQYDALMSRITRTEGQCALFISVLDSLRVQLLGHRLSSPEPIPTQKEFINVMKEMQLQLDSINKALSELDMPMPIPNRNETIVQTDDPDQHISS
jgi:hypothetical protein